jgi:hypothetical protein
VGISNIAWELRDNGGRRTGIDRRYFSYSDHIPERRRAMDRRASDDRRSGSDRRYPEAKVININEDKRERVDRRSAWG